MRAVGSGGSLQLVAERVCPKPRYYRRSAQPMTTWIGMAVLTEPRDEPGRFARPTAQCQTDFVLSLQGEEVFPSPVSPM